MMKRSPPNVLISFLLIFLSLVICNRLPAQGCSDAGVCTIHSMQHLTESDTGLNDENHLIAAGITYGLGSRAVNVLTPYVEYNYAPGKKINLSAKLTYAYTNGELGSHAGPGDLFLSSAFRLSIRNEKQSSMLIGVKIPLSFSDAGTHGNSYPMIYQASLGSYDLIVGYAFHYHSLGTGVALQYPFIHNNQNSFLSSIYPDRNAVHYLSTNKYKRKGDVVARVSYEFSRTSNLWSLSPGIVPVFHLGDDSYIDSTGKETIINRSRGLTLNGMISMTYQFSRNRVIEMSLAAPFIGRKAIPDGLKRFVVVSAEYKRMF